MDQADTIRTMIDAIRSADIDAFAGAFAADAVMRHPLAPAVLEGRTAIRESEQALFAAFSDIEIEVVSMLGDAGRAAVEVVLRATNTGPLEFGEEGALPPTGRRIELPAVWVLEFDADGLISAERDYLDTATLMHQLGLHGDGE